jgi:hypothetical protein
MNKVPRSRMLGVKGGCNEIRERKNKCENINKTFCLDLEDKVVQGSSNGIEHGIRSPIAMTVDFQNLNGRCLSFALRWSMSVIALP